MNTRRNLDTFSSVILAALGLLLLGSGLRLSTGARAAPSERPSEASYTVDCTAGVGDVGDLIADINTANLNPNPDVLVLGAGCVYTLTAVDNYWYGPNGLPPITSTITISGRGATIVRDPAAPAFRLFYVGGEPTNISTGILTLFDLALEGGVAQGGHGGWYGGGGGMGAGGAIYNQGHLRLENVTLVGNTARGGNGAPAASTPSIGSGGGGGMGGNGSNGGGGFNPNYGAGGNGGGFLSAAEGGRSGSGGGAGGTSPVGGNGAGHVIGTGGGGGGFVQNGSGSTAGLGGGNGGSSGGGGTGGGGGAFGGGGGVGTRGTDLDGGGGGGGGVGSGGGGGAMAASVPGGAGGGHGGHGGFGGGGGCGGPGNWGGGGGNGGFGGGGGGGWSARGYGGFGGGYGSVFASGIGSGSGGGGGGLGGAIFNHTGNVTLTNTTLAQNTAQGGDKGPGLQNSQAGTGYGGGIFNLDGQVTLLNTTIAANTVAAGSGGSPATPRGGAVYNRGESSAATMQVENTILADTVGGDDCAGSAGSGSNTITSLGYNLVESGCLATFLQTGDIPGEDPLLGPLTGNPSPGSSPPVQTMALLPGSPAIDGGSNSGCPPIDARGVSRPQDGNRDGTATCDVGAYEKEEHVTILKQVNTPDADPGDAITYTIVFTAGTSYTLTGVVITDAIPISVTGTRVVSSGVRITDTQASPAYVWQVQDLAPGERGTITVTGVLSASLPPGEVLTNTARASCFAEGLVRLSDSSAVVTIYGADLAVGKSANATRLGEGEAITYTLVLTNHGPRTATSIIIDDPLPAQIDLGGALATTGVYSQATGQWTVSALAAGNVATLTITGTVDANTAARTFTNTARLNTSTPIDTLPHNDESSAVVTVLGADLSLTKTVDDPAPQPAGVITYTLVLANQGPDPTSGVVIGDPLPAGVTYAWSKASAGTYITATGGWDVGDLAVGQTVTLTLAATVDWGMAGQTITNTATVSQTGQLDSITGNDGDAAVLTVDSNVAPSLQITKTVDTGGAEPVSLGGIVTYTMVFHNAGDEMAYSGVLTDSLPAGLAFDGWLVQTGADVNGRTIQWGPADLVPMDVYTISFRAGITTSVRIAGKDVINTATFRAANGGPASASASFRVEGYVYYLPVCLNQ